ncbi:hypothetical protein LHJ74_20330 [Streptomyces sp. N2-109]|uniref:Uncharacterized protein n=1 Tax=Streptomyces gossypii TaxID=2883101 RepID=A0ABT2JWG7_9ACTN|nr:hypothetical protein [Streptomyces gossypii]MCT2592220.1 hypothetical protein [Streptomyces gossypii]
MTEQDPQQEHDESHLPNTVSEILEDADPASRSSSDGSRPHSPGFTSPDFEGPGLSEVQIGNSELGQQLRDEQTGTHPETPPATPPPARTDPTHDD